MRVFLLAALAATAYGAACGEECVGAIFTEVAKATAGGYKEADLGLFAYLLWKGYDTAGEAGAKFVYDAVTFVGGADACNASTKTDIVKCFKEASADDVTKIDKMITDAATSVMSDAEKGYARDIFGALAGHFAPGSEPAKKWTKALTDDELTKGIKVVNIVGTWNAYVQPTLDAAFDDAAKKQACVDEVFKAIGYTKGTGDLAVAIATKGEEAWGANGLGSAKCFGEGSPAKVTFTVTVNGKAVEYDETNTPTKVLDAEKKKADEAVTSQLTAAGVGTSDTTSPAAVLSAAAAVIAMML